MIILHSTMEKNQTPCLVKILLATVISKISQQILEMIALIWWIVLRFIQYFGDNKRLICPKKVPVIGDWRKCLWLKLMHYFLVQSLVLHFGKRVKVQVILNSSVGNLMNSRKVYVLSADITWYSSYSQVIQVES